MDLRWQSCRMRMSEQITRPQIEVGARVGKLTVTGSTAMRKNGYIVWRCACDCGGEILLDTRALQRGAIRDCGCGWSPKVRRDLSGQRFGKLICLEPTQVRGGNGAVIWRCLCDCGNECLAVSTQLTKGYRRSCGCLGKPPLKDFVGRRFGSLTVTGYAGKRDGKQMWRCRCDCGGEVEVSQGNLQNGRTKSCGCLRRGILKQNLKIVDGTSVTMIENRMKKPIRSNKSGCSGVYYSEKQKLWRAQITFKGKTYYLGTYTTLADAVKARKRGEEMYENFLEWYHREYLSDRQVSQDANV